MNSAFPCLVNVAYGDPSPAGLPVSLGVPFKPGVLRDPVMLAVTGPDGEVRPAAGRALARWPDGSVRWCLVSFGARLAGAHRVEPGIRGPAPAAAVTVAREGDRWRIRTDKLDLEVCETGPGVFGRIASDGHEFLAAPGDLSLNVDDASTRREERRTVRVVEASPLRARLRVEGDHRRADGSRLLSYRLDVEVWAGWPAVRLDYHYFNLEPGQDSLTVGRIALDTAWNLGSATHRHFLQKSYGLFYVSRHVWNPDPVAIVSTLERNPAGVEDPAMLLDDTDYPFYLHAPLVNTAEWLGVGNGERAVYGWIGDFTEAKPNRLASRGNGLSAELWPASAGPLELPQGRSRRQSVMLAFVREEKVGGATAKMSAAPVQAPKGVAAILAAPVHEGRAAVSPEWIAQSGEFRADRALPVGKHVRIETNLHGLVRLDMPNTKFDVGDTDSHYNSSYSTLGEVLVHRLPGAPEIPRTWPRSAPTQTYLDCHEPVWTNNEYDVIHAFCGELMRTGRVELWPTLRLAARHNIEVDFLHYSDHRWLHRATPAHSARHTTTGAYPSHFWTQGLLEYYCLTGDIDALEVAQALGDKTLENFGEPELRKVLWGFNREIGWSILALACLVEVTGEARFRPLLDEMVNYLLAFDRGAYKGGINLSGGNDRQSLNRQIVGNFFGYGSMMEGVDIYADLSGRPEAAAWLTKLCHDLADEAMNAAREGEMRGIDFGTCVSIGHERTGDPRFMQLAGLLLDAVYWTGNGVQGGGSVKPVAYSYRNLPRLLGHAWRAGLLEAYEYPSMRGRMIR